MSVKDSERMVDENESVESPVTLFCCNALARCSTSLSLIRLLQRCSMVIVYKNSECMVESKVES